MAHRKVWNALNQMKKKQDLGLFAAKNCKQIIGAKCCECGHVNQLDAEKLQRWSVLNFDCLHCQKPITLRLGGKK